MTGRAGRGRALAALAFLGTVAWAGCGRGGPDGGVVRFGVAAPLEQSYGANALRGAEIARAEINAGGGIGGRTLEFVARSDSADPEVAVRVANEFFADRSVIAVIGHVNSGATLAAATVYNRGLVAVAPSATSPEITHAGDWVFRVAPSDAANARVLADFALRSLGRRVAVLFANEPYGRGLKEAFVQAFVAGGGRVLEEHPYLEVETRDFEPYLLSVRRAAPDFVFIAGLEDGAALIIEQARALGIRVPFLGGDGLVGLVRRGPVFDGTYVGLLYHPDTPGAPSRAFVQAYRERYGEDPDPYAALAYDAARLLVEAAREAGPQRAKIRAYLADVGRAHPPMTGATGPIRFDENGDVVGKPFAVGRIAGGRIELVSVETGS